MHKIQWKKNILYQYKNGNYEVTIYSDGTKTRENNKDFLSPSFPESIDMKITNQCRLNCPYCHERSHSLGKHANTSHIFNALKGMPSGIEIAIGGGNPLQHPELIFILRSMRAKGYIPNLTVNIKSLFYKDSLGNRLYMDLLLKLIKEKLIYGVGLSYTNSEDLMHIFKDLNSITSNCVVHLIAGIHNISDIKFALKIFKKVLILGYKDYGRGAVFNKENNQEIEKNIKELQGELSLILNHISNNNIISFDNLAIEQLNIRDMVLDCVWNMYYMGDDGKFTMYYDAVENKYAKSSISERKSGNSIRDFFNKFLGNKK